MRLGSWASVAGIGWVAAGLAGVSSVEAQEALPEIAVSAPADASPATSGDGLQRGPVNITDTSFQSTTAITGREIARSSAASLADLLSGLPGVSSSTFAPGASRPNIRGLDDYRVRVQENGIGTQDASDFSQDHAVPVDPLSADKIEVIRGPATLRYGSQAIGGVVSATNNRIPEALTPGGFSARFKGGASSVDSGLDGATSLDASGDNVAIHADAYARHASDYRIPGGVQANTRLHSEGQSVGGSYIFDGGYIGTAIQHITSLYHIPGVIDAREKTRIDLEQTKWTGKGEWRAPTEGIDAVRFTFGASDYHHNELGIGAGGIDGVQNIIRNQELEGRFELDHATVATGIGALTGTWGAQIGHRELGTAGSLGGLLSPTKTDTAAIFGFEQIKFTDTLRLQVAGRIENHLVKGLAPSFPADFLPPPTTFTEQAGRRSFAPKSASVGLLKDLPWDMVATLTAQRAQRAPAAPELSSRGSDDASGTFVIGNPNLRIETAQTAEIGLKRAKGQLRFEGSLYYTYYNDFIFKQVTGNFCVDAFSTCGAAGPLIQVAYGQRDAIFRGAELAAQLDVTPLGDGVFGVDGQYDIVRATFTDGTNVPRIAPMRLGGGLWWRSIEWYARVGLLHAFTQNDVALNETPTDGYNLLKAELSYTHTFNQADNGPREITVGLAGDNLLNERIRNHISFKKAEVLQPGMGVRLFTNVRF
ncbi:TonB-dependent receptor [soil metagenome]